MSATTMKSFAQSTGQSANQKSGGFKGILLGKMADGAEALEAIKALATNQANRFYELAMQAVHVTKQKLEAAKTMPFASPDIDFNPSLNPARAISPQAPGLGAGSANARQKKETKRKDE